MNLSNIWDGIWPNLLANILWAAPAFAAHHILIKRHIDKKHKEIKERICDLG